MAKEIPLTQGKVALVDDADYEMLMAFKWSACCSGLSWYARAHMPGSGHKGKNVLMHRLLLSPPNGLETDHVNHDGLDNRRANLRVVTSRQNKENRRGAERRNACGVRGVTFRVKTGRYIAQVMAGGRHYHIGSYGSLEEAGAAAAAARAQLMTHSPECAKPCL